MSLSRNGKPIDKVETEPNPFDVLHRIGTHINDLFKLDEEDYWKQSRKTALKVAMYGALLLLGVALIMGIPFLSLHMLLIVGSGTCYGFVSGGFYSSIAMAPHLRQTASERAANDLYGITIGSITGMVVGAVVGALLLSLIFPGVGTMTGAVLGATIGSGIAMLGVYLANTISQFFIDKCKPSNAVMPTASPQAKRGINPAKHFASSRSATPERELKESKTENAESSEITTSHPLF